MGEGPPVVLVHGLLLGSLAQWYFTAAPALATRHRVVLYDLRGHGKSSRERSGYDLATLASDLHQVLVDQAVTGPVDLVGHSYGGLIALRYASTRPANVRRLVLIDVPLPPGALTDEATGASPAELLAMLPAPVRAEVERGGRRARLLLDRLGFLVQDSTLLTDVAREPPLTDDVLAAVTAPTLCVVGETSRCRPDMDRLARVLRAETLVVPGGHFVPLEAPDALNGALVGFLDG